MWPTPPTTKVAAYLTVNEAHRRAQLAISDFEALWWLWSVQAAWSDSVRDRALALFASLERTSFRTTVLAWAVAHVHGADERRDECERRVQALFDEGCFEVDLFQTARVAFEVHRLFQALDRAVVVRECELPIGSDRRKRVMDRLKAVLGEFSLDDPPARRAIAVNKVLMCVAGFPALLHHNPCFKRVMAYKLEEFGEKMPDERSAAIMAPVQQYVAFTMFQTPLEAWAQAMRAQCA